MLEDDRPAFDRFCRQRGTRINDIMTRLERGEDEESIARRYHTQPETIHVYRLALEGLLTTGSKQRVRVSQAAEAMIVVLHVCGLSAGEIAKRLDMAPSTVGDLLRRKRYKRYDEKRRHRK